ncbi:MAG: protein phosphatase 2C domain-containing protein [Bacteroidaceae bacterium]|nr:protein phosphatase 2C domain-containing protein [Bacteroidaceae bacterium]
MKIKIQQPLAYSEIGGKPNQEDSIFPLLGEATKETRVFIVCDGMGGHEKGEVASDCVAKTIGGIMEGKPLCDTAEMKITFQNALKQAYENLDKLDNSQSQRKMGTTLTFMALCSDGIFVAHIGDSRVYQFRKGEGVVFQTRDHSLVNELIAAGELSEEDARTFPQRNVIMRAIQPHQDYPCKATYNIIKDVRKGDVFMLCCDGVIEQLENNDLSEILLEDCSLDNRLLNLKNECLKRNTRDNNTAYIIEVEDVEGLEKPSATVMLDEKETKDDVRTFVVENQKKNKNLIWIVLSVIVIIVTFVCIFFLFAPSSDKPILKKDNTQGTIQHRNK